MQGGEAPWRSNTDEKQKGSGKRENGDGSANKGIFLPLKVQVKGMGWDGMKEMG